MLLRCAIQLPVGGKYWTELSAKDGGAVTTRANCASGAPERTRPTEPLGLLLVEPNPLERAHLVDLCAHTGGAAQVIAEVSVGSEAFRATEALRPDVIVVASTLSDMTGLEAVRALRDRYRRRAILVIASPQERPDALAAGVLDYLMRPIEAGDFETSLLRARGRFGARKQAPRPAASSYSVSLRSGLECDRPFILIAEREQRLYPVQPRRIDYVESAGNYVKFHVDKFEYIARESIKRLEIVLARAGFVRIERKLLLNILAISYVETVGHGAFAFTLNNGVCLHSGPAYRETILRALPLRRRAWGAGGAGGERERNSAANSKIYVSKIPPSARSNPQIVEEIYDRRRR
jgi:two-component system LytT family response regulator